MLTLIVTTLLSATAYAGIIIGNGGIGLDCGPDKPVRLLDLVEAEEYYYKDASRPKLTLADPAGETEREKFFSLMVRVKQRFPDLADRITKEYAAFETKTRPVEDMYLGDPRDALEFALPVGCTPKTVILQQPRPAFRRTPRFTRDEALWRRVPVLDRMYFGVHEAIYSIGLERGVEHSQGVRYVVALLAANEANLISDAEWIEGFRQARIPYYEAAGMRIPLFSGDMKPCDLPVGAMNCLPQVPSWRKTEFQFDEDDQIAGIEFGPGGAEVEFVNYDATVIKVRTEKLTFDRGAGDLRIAFHGDMSFVSSLTSLAETNMKFEGSFWPRGGHLDGVQIVGDMSKRPLLGSVASVWSRVAHDDVQASFQDER